MSTTTETPEPRVRTREELRLLLVEDNPGDARLVRTYLEEGLNGSHELSRVGSLAEGLDRAGRGEPDLVLLDLDLPDATGLEAVRRMREMEPAPPIVVLTGLDDEETATYALGEGAQDYLVKGDLDPAVLERTIRYSLERHRVSRELERTREAVEAERALSRSILQSLPDHIAVLDAAGEIIGTNEAWRRFAAEEGGEPRGYEGDNYLEVTRAAAREDGDAARMLEGLEAVLAGESEGFVAEYPCHGPDARRWFRASVTPLREAATEGAVVSHIDITERKRAVRELEEERARLEEIFRQAPAWMAVFRGPDHVFELVNPSFRQMVGDRDVVGLPVREAFPELEGEDFFELLDEVYRSGEPVEEKEKPLRLEDGDGGWRTKYVTLVYQPRWEDGEVTGVISHGVDVTEQVRARREIEQAEQRWSTMLETMTEAVILLDREGRITFANPAAERLFGLEASEIEGRSHDDPAWEILGPDGEDLPAEDLPFPRVLASGEPVTGAEHTVRRGNGERVRFSVNAAPVRDAEGQIEGVVASLRDVTRVRQREQALRESEERFRALFEKSLDPIVVTTPAGEFVAANDAWRDLFGYGPDDIASMEVSDIYADPADRERFLAAVEREGGVSDFEAELVTRRGEVRICRISCAPLEASDGRARRLQTIIHDVTDRRRLEEELRHRALHDELTGLPNRTLFVDRLKQALARSRRRGEGLGVLMVDLDRFKRINDSLGHTAGDRVLQEVAQRLRESVRAEDTVARWGGDEFAVILSELSSRSDMETVEERIQKALARPCTVAGEALDLGAGVGGVVQGIGDGDLDIEVEEPEELVRYADAALLRAKGGSASSFHLFDASRDSDQMNVLQREQDLQRGLEAGEFEPFYQPIVHLETGRVWGVEPLARWRHPEKGLTGPAEFVPLAEETGLIHRLGHQICERSFRDAARWSDELGFPVRVTPNVSGRQFEDEEAIGHLRDCLESSGLDPGQVHLEVTETSIMRATSRIEQLRALGVRVQIDDFGTGYSSLVYLRDLEVDGLKIDMSFVQGLGEGRGNSAIVRTILTLSRELGLDVVAEGIETSEQLRILREMGCGLGQGYRFARPMPASEIEQRLAEGFALPDGGAGSEAA